MPSKFFKLTSNNQFKYFLLVALACLSGIYFNRIALAQNQANQKIVATFLPIYLFTKGVVGSQAQVDILIPPGTEVHEYQATPVNAKILAEADVLVENGLGIEEFLANLIANVGNSQLQQIDSSQGIQVIQEEHEGEEHSHEHEQGNPHVWLDPVLAQQQVANIRDGLIAVDATNAETYRSNANTYIQQLQQLDREFAQRLAPFKGCKFIAFHDAFPYLAKRYGLEQEAVVELPEDNITPKDIQRVQTAAKQYQVKALLSEPGIDDRRLQQIASDLNLPVQILDPLESGEIDPQYYFEVMRRNLESLEKACQ